MSSFTLTEQQSKAIRDIEDWYNNRSHVQQVYRLFGAAGTGKSSLIKYFTDTLNKTVVYGAYTGKASLVMRKKDCDGATTIHSLIYIPQVNEFTGEVSFIFNDNSVVAESDLIVIDEVSMVDDKIANDLLSYGVPIIVLGDPFQLAPVEGEGYFTRSEPDFLLTEIHRQALDNPLIWASNKVRNGYELSEGTYGDSIVTSKFLKRDVMCCEQIIVGLNKTRHDINRSIRKALNFTDDLPMEGERLICIKNKSNRQGQKIHFNGEMYKVVNVKPNQNVASQLHQMNVYSDDTEMSYNVKAWRYIFDNNNYKKPEDWKTLQRGVDFDYGYAITCHKSQGSQYESVYVVDESHSFREHRNRWLYTALTRPTNRFILYKEK